jgi:hypothetical protein
MRHDRLLYGLLAAIVLAMVGTAAAAAFACLWRSVTGLQDIGACITSGVAQQIRETWAEAAALVLALLLASKPKD